MLISSLAGENSIMEIRKMQIREIDESACINRLMALEGAIRGIKKTLLPDEVKAELKEYYQANKIK